MSSTGEAGTRMRAGSAASSPAEETGTLGGRDRSGERAPERRDAPPGAPPDRTAGGRRVKLTVSRVDPWSTMKISFLLSIALGIAGVVMVAVLWSILAGMGAFEQVNRMITSIIGSQSTPFDLMDFVGFGRVVSLSVVVGVVDVVLMTALATLSAILYNICSALVGGLQVTLTDD